MSVWRLISWSLLATCVNAGVQLSKLSILARTLAGEELGIYSILVAVTSLFLLIQDFGITAFLVQRRHASARLRMALYRLSIALGFLTGLGMFAFAGLLGLLYSSMLLFKCLALSSLNYIVLGLSSQYQGFLIRDSNLRALSIAEVLANIVGLLAFLILVWLETGLYAYIASIVVFSALKLCILRFSVRWRPNWRLKCGRLFGRKDALRFGAYQVGGQLLNHIRSRLDVLLLGKIVGLGPVGLYGLAKETVMRPQGLLQPIVARVALPVFAKRLRDGEDVGPAYITALSRLAYINAVLFLGIMVLAEWIAVDIYRKSDPELPLLIALLALFAFLRSLGMPIASLTQSSNKTWLDFRWNVVALIFGLFPIGLAFKYPLVSIAAVTVVVQFFLTNLSFFLVVRPCAERISYKKFLLSWFPAFVVLVIVGYLVYA